MRALLVCFALGFVSACISNDDVSSALATYCGLADGKAACDADSECCPGFGCLNSVCRLVTDGACFVPDGGQASGAACGCARDCSSGACTAAKCQ